MTDSYFDLTLGIREEDFVFWSQCVISDANESELSELLMTRIESEEDAIRLFSLAFEAQKVEGVRNMQCSVDIALMKAFLTPKNLVSALFQVSKEFSHEITTSFLLSIDSNVAENCVGEGAATAFSLLGSEMFSGISFRGARFVENPANFERFLLSARRHLLKIVADIRAFPMFIEEDFFEKATPNIVVAFPSQAQSLLAHTEILKKLKTTLIFTPQSTKTPSSFQNTLLNFKNDGVCVQFGSGSRLLHKKRFSDFLHYFNK